MIAILGSKNDDSRCSIAVSALVEKIVESRLNLKIVYESNTAVGRQLSLACDAAGISNITGYTSEALIDLNGQVNLRRDIGRVILHPNRKIVHQRILDKVTSRAFVIWNRNDSELELLLEKMYNKGIKIKELYLGGKPS